MGERLPLMPRLPAAADRNVRLERLGWRAGACFEAHRVRFGVRTNEPGLLLRLPETLPPGSRRSRSPDVDQVFSLWVAREGRRPSVTLWSGQGPRLRLASPEAALLALESELRRAVATAAPELVFVHAGVVGWRGRALLVPGRSRSGKTTLVEALVRQGASYLSDEYAPLDRRGRVHPFAKPLTIRGPGGCDRHARRSPVEEWGGTTAGRALPVGLVAFTEYRSGATWAPEPLSPGRAVLELLSHTVPARLRPEASLAALSRAAAVSLRLAGPRGEAAETARRLLDTLEGCR